MLAELAALDEAADDLHVGTVAVVHADHDDPLALLRGPEDPLRARGRHGQRLLHEHVQVGRERGQNVRLVQVVGRADESRVEAIRPEQVLDVVDRVPHAEPVGERARFREIGVADSQHLDRS